jgi:hypothetical protein
MSTEAYQRSSNREAAMWPVFLYSAPFNTAQLLERATNYSLYANSYTNNYSYLKELEAVELSHMLDDYNAKIAALTNDETVLVLQIAAKRYLSDVEIAMHGTKMLTLSDKIASDSADMGAKFAALTADQVVLLTLAARLSADTKSTEARIDVLQAEASEEDIRLDLAELEKSEKEIQLSKTELATLRVANEVLHVQTQIIEAGLALLEVDQRKSELNIRIANVDIDILQADYAEDELTILQKQGEIVDKELEIAIGENAIYPDQKAAVDLEKALQQQIHDQNAPFIVQTALNRATHHTATMNDITKSDTMNTASLARQLGEQTLDRTSQTNSFNVWSAGQDDHMDLNIQRVSDAAATYSTAVAAATKMATANVVSTLTHTIGTKA